MNVLWEYENRFLADVSTGGNGVARRAMLLLTSQVPCEMQAFSVDPIYGGAKTTHASLERLYAARVLWTTVLYLKKTRCGLFSLNDGRTWHCKADIWLMSPRRVKDGTNAVDGQTACHTIAIY